MDTVLSERIKYLWNDTQQQFVALEKRARLSIEDVPGQLRAAFLRVLGQLRRRFDVAAAEELRQLGAQVDELRTRLEATAREELRHLVARIDELSVKIDELTSRRAE